MRSDLDRSCREKKTPHFVSVFLSENRALYEVTWKNMVETDSPQTMNIRGCVRFECWVANSTDTHSECVIFIDFPRQH